MKRSAAIPLVFIVLAALTGCLGDYAESAEMEASRRAASSASPSTLKAIPDVAGKTYEDAKATLNNIGLTVVAIGKDGKQWSAPSPDASVKVCRLTLRPAQRPTRRLSASSWMQESPISSACFWARGLVWDFEQGMTCASKTIRAVPNWRAVMANPDTYRALPPEDKEVLRGHGAAGGPGMSPAGFLRPISESGMGDFVQ